ncbi:UDP-glucose 4-epimerase GalE [Vreelandella alkaliphila]|uniref:UDP-glucose 4-epimerase GalE n=1 Tax=Vreelandella alkaliphila TaxID=272774 RepID=UPI0039F4B682
MRILITGGLGFLGSHTAVELFNSGFEMVVVDNLSNCSSDVINGLNILTDNTVDIVVGDIREQKFIDDLFESYKFDSVMHFAGLKSVAESVSKPLEYYDNNVLGSLNLLKAMMKANCKNLVFSSSATVYGEPSSLPIKETASRVATNPYGQTKLVIEDVLMDLATADPEWSIANLRYFNPVGAHQSGLIGEDPKGVPNNLMPYISQVAYGLRDRLNIYGDDYETLDGSGVRDYIHVVDLAKGHLSALKYLISNNPSGFQSFNLGTGKGISVYEMIKAFEFFNGVSVPFVVVDRRPGDISACFADVRKANDFLGWYAELGLKEMCEDVWRWQLNNN